VGDATGFAKLLQTELGALVAGIEARSTEVNGVRAIRDRRADGIQLPRRGQ